MQVRFALTTLGVGWSVMTLLLTGVLLGLTYAVVFDADWRMYVPFVMSGLVPWYFVATCLSEGPVEFGKAKSLLLNSALPLWVFSVAAVIRNLITLFMGLPVVIAIALVVGVQPTFAWFLLVPNIMVLGILFVPIMQVLALLGARLRDVSILMPSITLLLFLITPIIWPASSAGSRSSFVELNPVYWIVEAVRSPILESNYSLNWIIASLLMSSIAYPSAIILTKLSGPRTRAYL